MRIRRLLAGAAAMAACGITAPAHAQGVPDTIKQRVSALVTACAQAGGQLGNMSGQGQFVIPADFNGDGQPDFVVSEGNVPCTGQPDLFRRDGQARVELFLGEGGNARLVFADDLLAYRVVSGTPARLQIARKGAGCGAGSPPAAQCGAELRWNGGARGFDEVPTGNRGGATQTAIRPAVILGGPPQAGPTPPETTAPATASASARPGAPPAALPANARATYLASCRKQQLAKYPQMTPENAEGNCTYQWDLVVAAGPLADAVLAAVPARGGDRPGLDDLRARLPQVRWDARPQGQPGLLASGQWDALRVEVNGPAPAASLVLAWRKVGAEIPYDLPAALQLRGATVQSLGCYHFGSVEQNQVYLVTLAPRPPFALTIYRLGAAFANSNAAQVFTADLTGRLPTLAELRAEHRDPPWVVPCPD
jgi:hypothetical protein